MAFEGLTEKLQGALRKLSSKGKLTEDNVKDVSNSLHYRFRE